ncbi:MAG: hypothetical protein QY331_14945 [Melioribacteraceae bacterium]|nr:MAG: hypothetical protein QY331_14945 [Melioribacteraceae bacterium]
MKTIVKVATILVFFSVSIMINLAEEAPNLSESEVATLIEGIKSENYGLMRSSIFIAGKYRVEEAVEALFEVLERESDPSNLVLVSLAIYRIGNLEAMMKVIETANNSENNHTKNILSAIAMNYLVENEIPFSLK